MSPIDPLQALSLEIKVCLGPGKLRRIFMKTTPIAFAFGLMALVGAQNQACAGPVYQDEQRTALQLREVTPADAEAIIAKVVEGQRKLRSGEEVYFHLLAGAPASYPMTTTSPRDAFLAADFRQPFSVERLPPANSSWKPYRLILTPNGVGNLLWEVEVVLGFSGQIEKVEMLYRPPHPF